MKTILLRESADSSEGYVWQESAVARRVVLSIAARTTTTCTVEACLRRGPAVGKALAHGDQDVIAAAMVQNSGHVVVDIPVYEMILEGDRWHINLKAIAGAVSEEYATALVIYEPGGI